MVSLRKRVFIYLKNNPNANYKDLKREFKKEAWNSVRTYRGQYFKEHGEDISGDIKSNINNNMEQLIQKYDWEHILKLAIFKIPPFDKLDVAALSFYDRMGWFQKDVEEQSGERYIYHEPEWLYEHQREMLKRMRAGNIMCWGMRQLTGKTTTALVACYEKMYENPGLQIIHISASEKLSKELIGKINSDPLVWEVWENQIKSNYRESKTLMNGSKLLLRPCKYAAVQGLTGGLWIDELDKILREKETRQAFAAILPIVIRPMIDNKAFIWITCNQAQGAGAAQFEYFKTVLSKFGNVFPICEIAEPTAITKKRELVQLNEFNVEIPQAGVEREEWFKNMMYELQVSIADEEFAKAQMLNIYDDMSGLWNSADLVEAFDTYNEEDLPEWPLNVIEAVDPGAQHGTGVFICSMDTSGHIYELFAHKYFHTQISEERFKQVMMDKYDEFGVKLGLCESSYGGLFWIDHWRGKGYSFQAANFGTANPRTGETSNATKAVERHYKERVVKYLLEKKRLHLHNRTLFKEFSLYNPTENKEAGKGDILDAALHAIFEIVGGIKFVVEILADEGEEQAEVAYTL